jgi:hypothetical protein
MKQLMNIAKSTKGAEPANTLVQDLQGGFVKRKTRVEIIRLLKTKILRVCFAELTKQRSMLTMAEYIEREKLIDELEHLHEDAELSYLGVYDCVKSVPTADVVPVVRCKDCKNYNTFGCADGFGWCENFNNGVTDEHYCSYGERKNSND